MTRKMSLMVGVVVALMLALALVLRPTPGGAGAGGGRVAAATPGAVDSGVRSVSVAGQGEVKVTPDLARIVFSVDSSGVDLVAAQGDNAKRTQAVIDKLKALGIADADLQTSGYNVSPQYDKEQKLTGYRVANGVRVTVRDLKALGATIDAAVGAGANRISNLSFDVANKIEATRKAREAAVADARTKAEQYAQLTNSTLGLVLTISEGTAAGGPEYRTAPAATAAGGATPIEPGQGAITLSVQVTYELK